MSSRTEHSEDMFEDTRMTFGEHLEELRAHMLRAIYGFVIMLIFSFFIGKPVLQMIARPVEDQLIAFYDNRYSQVKQRAEEDPSDPVNQPRIVALQFDPTELAKTLGIKPPTDPPEEKDWPMLKARIRPFEIVDVVYKPLQEVGKRPGLTTLSVQEAFMAYFKVCLYCALVLGSPWIFFQMWLFVAAGLYPHEKKLVHVYLPVSLLLFLFGVSICQFIVIPRAIEALLWFNQWIGLEPDLRFNEWLSFAILMPLVFGIAFQMPLVMMFLERLGIVTTEMMIGQWRMAFFLIQVAAAVLSPSVDAVSMQMLALPMFGLYWLGIWMCRFNPPREVFEDEDLLEDEHVEV